MEPTLFREGTTYRRVETEGSYREQPLLFSSALHVNRLNWLFSISVNSETTKTFRMEATNSRRILLIVVVSYYRQSINAGKGLFCIIRTLVINLRQSATLHYRCWPPWRLYQVNKARRYACKNVAGDQLSARGTRRTMSGCKKKRDSLEEDVVLLHQLERGIFTPSISPFPMKLETYLRMASIPYKV